MTAPFETRQIKQLSPFADLPAGAAMAVQGDAGPAGQFPVDDALQILRDEFASTASGEGAGKAGFSQSADYSYPSEGRKLQGILSPTDHPYNAANDGSANDSAAFSSAISTRRNIQLPSGGYFAIKDVALSNSQSIIGNDSLLKSVAGAANLVVLKDYASRLANVYVADSTTCSDSAILVQGGRVDRIESVTLINTGGKALKFAPLAGSSAARGVVDSFYAEGITGIGVEIGSSTNDWRFSNFFLDGKLTFDGGGMAKPTVGMIGWKQNTPVVGGRAVGGHQLSNGTVIDCDTGYHFTDAQLTKMTNCIADSCSGYGLRIDGSSNKIDIVDFFCAFTGGIYVGDTSTDNFIDGLRLENTGVIPIWGQAGFYTVAGTYDLQVKDTASITIRNWRGSKKISVDSTATLNLLDGVTYEGRSGTTVAAGTATYLGEHSQNTTVNEVIWRAPYDCYLVRINATVTAAPGAGETFIYTPVVNGVDQAAMAQTIAGAGVFGAVDKWSGSLIPINKGTSIAIKLVTSGSAAVARHNCLLQIAPR